MMIDRQTASEYRVLLDADAREGLETLRARFEMASWAEVIRWLITREIIAPRKIKIG